MTIQELQQELDHAGVRPRNYDFEGTSRDEVYCLDKVQAGWRVYYRERGNRNDETLFPSEDEACRHVLQLLLRDRTTRQ